jgi:hypothetical protein
VLILPGVPIIRYPLGRSRDDKCGMFFEFPYFTQCRCNILSTTAAPKLSCGVLMSENLRGRCHTMSKVNEASRFFASLTGTTTMANNACY